MKFILKVVFATAMITTCLFTGFTSKALAKESGYEELANRTSEQWIDKVFNDTGNYSVLTYGGEDKTLDFIRNNRENHIVKNYQLIEDYIVSNQLMLSGNKTCNTYSTTRTCTKEVQLLKDTYGENGTVRAYLSTYFSVLLRVDENTGVIRSYEGPYLNSIAVTASPFQAVLGEISCYGTLSSTKRTITMYGDVSVTVMSGVGTDRRTARFIFQDTCG